MLKCELLCIQTRTIMILLIHKLQKTKGLALMKTRVIDKTEFIKILNAIGNGFTYIENETTKKFRPNQRVKLALMLEGNLGIRIGDIVSLTLNGFRNNGINYTIDIIEEKTKKQRSFTVPIEIYNVIKIYVLENGIKSNEKLFNVSERAVQKQLKIVADYLGLQDVSTHSFRKFYANEMFNNNEQNIELVRTLLQHSSIAVTQKYLGVSSNTVENAIAKHIYIV